MVWVIGVRTSAGCVGSEVCGMIPTGASGGIFYVGWGETSPQLKLHWAPWLRRVARLRFNRRGLILFGHEGSLPS